MKHALFLSVTLTLTGLTGGPLTAQQFGSAVAVSADHVAVQKASGQGPATVYLFARGPNGWEVRSEVTPPGAAETGEGFSASLAFTGSDLFVASGDPEARWGADIYTHMNGAWSDAARLRLAEAADAERGPVTLATVFRILQPPTRVVAATNDLAIVALVGNAAGAGVRVFQRENGSWRETGRLETPDVNARSRFGTALAVDGDRVLVGAPGHQGTGAVFVFAPDTMGGWSVETMLTAAGLAARAGFGTAIAAHGNTVVVGAPGSRGVAGTAIAFARERDGWREVGRLAPESNAPGELFGVSIGLTEHELWIGAPFANEGRGTVHRFTRQDDTWHPAPTIQAGDLDAGSGFGMSVSLGDGVAVVGAPRADGGAGRAAVYERTADGTWSGPTWLAAGTQLEAVVGSEVRCENGTAAGFHCSDVDLLAYLPVSALGGTPGEGVSDLWGWSDPETGREYALVGRTRGLAIVDITDPSTPVFMGLMAANPSGARDIKVYADHAFMTGDGAGNHGLLVFDLTRLRGVTNPPADFTPDAVYDRIASAHNLVINTESGLAFPVGASGGGETCGGGLHMIDIRDPKHPTFAGCYTDTEGLLYAGRTHDAQCVAYRGPDTDYQGRDICFASNETALRIVDVTDRANPHPIAKGTYPGRSYVHQGWLTEDQRYFYLDDELDELVGNSGGATRTIIWDLADLDDPVVLGEFRGSTPATDHNLYIKGDRMYQANYQAGLRVIDISDREHPLEIGYFDTTPYEGNPPGFNGAWTAFPFFESGTVIVSSMREGLFILRPRPALVP